MFSFAHAEAFSQTDSVVTAAKLPSICTMQGICTYALTEPWRSPGGDGERRRAASCCLSSGPGWKERRRPRVESGTKTSSSDSRISDPPPAVSASGNSDFSACCCSCAHLFRECCTGTRWRQTVRIRRIKQSHCLRTRPALASLCSSVHNLAARLTPT